MSFTVKHFCPRRNENPAANLMFPDGDEWKAGRCSYCGSMHPDRFMELVRAGSVLGTTSKSYKVYVENGKFYFQHLSHEQRQEFVDLYNARKVNTDFPFNPYPFFMVPAD